jgi:hypothetical protein
MSGAEIERIYRGICMGRTLSVSQIIGATFALILGDLPIVLVMLAGISAAATIIDVTAPSAGNILNIPVLVVQYYLIRHLIDRQGLRSADRLGGFGSFFVVGLITGLAILLGCLLLILPGLYLSARWAMVDAAVVGENRGYSDAMRRSWDASEGNVLPIALAILAISVPMIIGLALMLAIDPPSERSAVYAFGFSAILNFLLYASQICIWYLGVALYKLLLADSAVAELGEVFG